MKVLFGWELGGGQGHIQRLVALAQMLMSQGIEPVFALKSYNIKGASLPGQIVLAPRLPFSGRSESYTFADILEAFGFGNANLLRSHLQAWQAVISEVKPNLVVTDHAPGLVLAARGIVPTIVTGDSFAVPPAIEVFPPLRFPIPPESAQRQQQVSRTVTEVIKSETPLGQVLRGDTSLIFSIPELDPYRHLRTDEQYISLHITPIPKDLHSSAGKNWAYLYDDFPYRNLVLETLRPNCDFKPLSEVLAGKSLAIHHGSSTTSIACLLAGIPQLIFPQYLEHQLNGMALLQQGVGVIASTLTWEGLLMAQAKAHALTENALQKAESLACWNQNLTSIFVDTCFRFIV
jgi:hypothetical protein